MTGIGLDKYLTVEHADAVHYRSGWMEHLNQPLPQTGSGISWVVKELLCEVIPNGSAVPGPGFCGYITTSGIIAGAHPFRVLFSLCKRLNFRFR